VGSKLEFLTKNDQESVNGLLLITGNNDVIYPGG
jgi:hypothetical protein